jgi:pre-mRNA-processing factor 17
MRFADDKTIRVWELGIPVQVKYIADPSLHAISAAALSNSGKWWVGQSADNQVLTYTGDDRTRPMRKKTFRGHSSAGYACQLGFSPDDRYVLSGDGDGKVFIWDWKSTKVARSLKAHEGVCIGVAWHPLEASRVATCGWDGAVKLWD